MDQSVPRAAEETPIAGAHHTLLPGGPHTPRWEAGGLAQQPCLLSYVLCLIPEVLIMTGDLSFAPAPRVLPGLSQGLGGGKHQSPAPSLRQPIKQSLKQARTVRTLSNVSKGTWSLGQVASQTSLA